MLTVRDRKSTKQNGCEFFFVPPLLLLLAYGRTHARTQPTNHLDVEAIEWLEKLLAERSLTLVCVTHDRYFLENVCQEIIELDSAKLYR